MQAYKSRRWRDGENRDRRCGRVFVVTKILDFLNYCYNIKADEHAGSFSGTKPSGKPISTSTGWIFSTP